MRSLLRWFLVSLTWLGVVLGLCFLGTSLVLRDRPWWGCVTLWTAVLLVFLFERVESRLRPRAPRRHDSERAPGLHAHVACARPALCGCECRPCTQAWWRAGRPHPPEGQRRQAVLHAEAP